MAVAGLSPLRNDDYFGPDGLLETFQQIKDTADKILHLNQDHMERASRDARKTADESLLRFGIGLAAATLLGGWFGLADDTRILWPIRAVTQSALAIGRGNLDQVVPVRSRDEVGQLAEAFNAMARQLRQYRQTDYARLLRTSAPARRRSTPFPTRFSSWTRRATSKWPTPPLSARSASPATATARQTGLAVASLPRRCEAPLARRLHDQRPYLPEEFDRVVVAHASEGEERTFLPQVLPIRDPYGNTLGAAVVLDDVTRFRLLDQIKSDLVATVSHELKTPLTSIRLVLHLLLEETVGPLTPKQTELLLDARDNAERLLAWSNNLLDLARLEHGGGRSTCSRRRRPTLLQCGGRRRARRGRRPRRSRSWSRRRRTCRRWRRTRSASATPWATCSTTP